MLSLFFAVLQNPEDESRFEVFYNKFHKTIYYIAYEHLKDKQSAEDCTQEILLHLAKNFHNIGDDFNDKRVWNYVRIVSKNMAIDMYRKNKRHSDHVVNADITDFFSIAEKDFDIFEEVQLKDAINNLPAEYQIVFYLKYVCNYSGAEIAEKLKISQSLVRKRCMIGMQLVKQYLVGEENE